MAPPTLHINEPMPAPHWALLERQLLDAITDAYLEFYDRYFDPRGYLLCVPRWGALDGADDAAENVDGLTDLYALGAPQVLLDRYRTGINGHIRQYTEARSPSTELARDGMYFREFPTSMDWLHNGEGYHPLFQEGLCDPRATPRGRRACGASPASTWATTRWPPTTTPSTASSAAS